MFSFRKASDKSKGASSVVLSIGFNVKLLNQWTEGDVSKLPRAMVRSNPRSFAHDEKWEINAIPTPSGNVYLHQTGFCLCSSPAFSKELNNPEYAPGPTIDYSTPHRNSLGFTQIEGDIWALTICLYPFMLVPMDSILDWQSKGKLLVSYPQGQQRIRRFIFKHPVTGLEQTGDTVITQYDNALCIENGIGVLFVNHLPNAALYR